MTWKKALTWKVTMRDDVALYHPRYHLMGVA